MKTGVAVMTTEMRKSGIDVVGDMPWGTHICLFYETKADLLDTLVSYCKAGLESQEFCLWVVAPPVREEDAVHALRRIVPDIDRYMADGSIEIVAARDWYLQDGTLNLERVIQGWNKEVLQRQRAEQALRRSEAYLAEAQRLSHTGSWAFNYQETVYWSEENFRIWGFDPQQGLPPRETVVQRIHPEDRDRVLECARQ